MGVRRVGKTTLARSLPDADHFDCELPRTRALLAGPESFLAARTDRTIVLDEIHFYPAGMRVFRAAYPDGPNLVAAADVSPGRPYDRTVGPMHVRFVALADLALEMADRKSRPE
jgi:hypothetical protein